MYFKTRDYTTKTNLYFPDDPPVQNQESFNILFYPYYNSPFFYI